MKSKHVLLGPSESSGCADQTEPEMERLFFIALTNMMVKVKVCGGGEP